jgi:hypothetical protein
MAGPGRPFGSVNVRSERPFGEALRIEIAAAGADQRILRAIARNLLDLAKQPEQAALPPSARSPTASMANRGRKRSSRCAARLRES